jgi:hypothetical protein
MRLSAATNITVSRATCSVGLEHHLKLRSLPELESTKTRSRRCPSLRGLTRTR